MEVDDSFDFELLMPRQNGEVARPVAQLLVRCDRDLNAFGTGRAEALAHDVSIS